MPLQHALASDNAEIIAATFDLFNGSRGLLMKNIKNQNKFGYNAFHQAVNSNQPEIVQYFINKIKALYPVSYEQELQALVIHPSKIKTRNSEIRRLIGPYITLERRPEAKGEARRDYLVRFKRKNPEEEKPAKKRDGYGPRARQREERPKAGGHTVFSKHQRLR